MTTGDTRLHALDALRAAMMLLGIVLHAAVSYVVTPLGDGWPYKDRSTNGGLDLIVYVIHLFRMPTFFFMAGFFAALVYERHDLRGFLRHRAKRLLVPLVVAWPLVVPTTGIGFLAALRRAGVDAPPDLLSTDPGGPVLGHLWFLEYLFLYCVAGATVVALAARWPAGWHVGPGDRVARALTTVRGSLVLGSLTGLTLLPMESAGLDTSGTIVPALRVFLAYAVIFAVGWCLFGHRDVVPRLGLRPGRHLAAALAAIVVHLALAEGQPFAAPWLNHGAPRLAAGIAMWQLIIGVTGGFVRYLPAERPAVRYLADASYWMYLTHLPVVLWTVALLAPASIGAITKCAIVVTIATVTTLGTYELFVRTTLVGTFLNGRRQRRRASTSHTSESSVQRPPS